MRKVTLLFPASTIGIATSKLKEFQHHTEHAVEELHILRTKRNLRPYDVKIVFQTKLEGWVLEEMIRTYFTTIGYKFDIA